MLLAVAIFAAPMRRVLLPEAAYGANGGRCLDGSMALYYYGEAVNASSTTWVIELEGGGEAVDADLDEQPTPTGPVDDILAALGSPTGPPTGGVNAGSDDDPDPLRRFLGTFLGVG